MEGGDEQKAYRRRQERRFPQHACELPEHPDRVYPVLPPNASRWVRVRRVLQKQVVGWSWSRPFRAIRPSTYALETEQARQTHSEYWWILHPFCRFVAIWQLVVIVNVAITTLLIPFEFGLKDPYAFIGTMRDHTPPVHPFMDDNHAGTKEYKADVAFVSNIVGKLYNWNESIFIVHMLLMFITGFYRSTKKQVVLAPSRIIKRYLTTWFVPDLLSCIQYASVHSSVIRQGYFDSQELSSSELMWATKFWIVCFLFTTTRLHYVFAYTNTWCKMGNLRPIARRGILYTILFFGFIVWATTYSIQIPMLVRGTHLFEQGCESWLMDPELGFFDVDQPHLMIRQLLLSLNRVVGVASSHIPNFSFETPRMTMEDTVVLLIIMWVSTAFKIVLFGLILEYVESENSSEVELEKVRSQVRNYLRDQHLPVHVRDKMLMFYSHRFEGRFFKERAVIAHLPFTIRNAVRLSSCRQLISSSPFFRNVPKSLVNNIVAALNEELFLPHDVVYASGDLARYLYFLAQGTVAVFLSTGEEVGHLTDSSSFGEMGLMLKEHHRRHVESVVALEVCEIFLLERSDFERLVRPLPRLYNRIRAAAMLRATDVTHMEWAEGYDGYDRDYSYESVRPVSPTSSTSGSTGPQTTSKRIKRKKTNM